jgi:hypothetical protein
VSKVYPPNGVLVPRWTAVKGDKYPLPDHGEQVTIVVEGFNFQHPNYGQPQKHIVMHAEYNGFNRRFYCVFGVNFSIDGVDRGWGTVRAWSPMVGVQLPEGLE